MSLTVQHINEDSSFLLLFSPEPQPPPPPSASSGSPPPADDAATTFRILVDPWLHGPSVVTAPWFAITRRVVPACVQHLSELGEPDLVIVSQNKPDHCHRATLSQLHPDAKTVVAAEPGAAKAIKSWNHFDPARVQALPRFRPGKKFSIATFYIPPLCAGGHSGLVTVSFIPAKNYMTGLHNAIGITYQAPTRTSSGLPGSTIDVSNKTESFHLSLSPTGSTRPPTATTRWDTDSDSRSQRPKTATTGMSSPMQNWPAPPPTPQSPPHLQYLPPPIFSSNDESPTSNFSSILYKSTSETSSNINSIIEPRGPSLIGQAQTLPTPPQSPYTPSSLPSVASQTSQPSASPSTNSATSPNPNLKTNNNNNDNNNNNTKNSTSRPRVLSVLYTPHGIPLNPDLMPYVKSHLMPRGALPLTLLLHSFTRATNPWYLGGNITAGVAGGVEIARGLMARCWLSAHDEDKDDRGFSVRRIKKSSSPSSSSDMSSTAASTSTSTSTSASAITSPEQVRRQLWEGPVGQDLKRKGWICDVRSLAAGQWMTIGQWAPGGRDLALRGSSGGGSGSGRGLGLGLEHERDGKDGRLMTMTMMEEDFGLPSSLSATPSERPPPFITTDLAAWRRSSISGSSSGWV